jgi:hypothetical protein
MVGFQELFLYICRICRDSSEQSAWPWLVHPIYPSLLAGKFQVAETLRCDIPSLTGAGQGSGVIIRHSLSRRSPSRCCSESCCWTPSRNLNRLRVRRVPCRRPSPHPQRSRSKYPPSHTHPTPSGSRRAEIQVVPDPGPSHGAAMPKQPPGPGPARGCRLRRLRPLPLRRWPAATAAPWQAAPPATAAAPRC